MKYDFHIRTQDDPAKVSTYGFVLFSTHLHLCVTRYPAWGTYHLSMLCQCLSLLFSLCLLLMLVFIRRYSCSCSYSYTYHSYDCVAVVAVFVIDACVVVLLLLSTIVCAGI